MRPENFLYEPIIVLLIVIIILFAFVDRNSMVGIDSDLTFCTILNSFLFFFATHHGLWDLGSLTRN